MDSQSHRTAGQRFTLACGKRGKWCTSLTPLNVCQQQFHLAVSKHTAPLVSLGNCHYSMCMDWRWYISLLVKLLLTFTATTFVAEEVKAAASDRVTTTPWSTTTTTTTTTTCTATSRSTSCRKNRLYTFQLVHVERVLSTLSTWIHYYYVRFVPINTRRHLFIVPASLRGWEQGHRLPIKRFGYHAPWTPNSDSSGL